MECILFSYLIHLFIKYDFIDSENILLYNFRFLCKTSH